MKRTEDSKYSNCKEERDERRQYPRIPFWYIVQYREYTPHKKYTPAKSKNLSLGGILLETNYLYPVSTLLELELDIPLDPQSHMYAKVIGEVIRTSVIEPNKVYDIAIRFISIPAEYSDRIKSLIQAFSNS